MTDELKAVWIGVEHFAEDAMPGEAKLIAAWTSKEAAEQGLVDDTNGAISSETRPTDARDSWMVTVDRGEGKRRRMFLIRRVEVRA